MRRSIHLMASPIWVHFREFQFRGRRSDAAFLGTSSALASAMDENSLGENLLLGSDRNDGSPHRGGPEKDDDFSGGDPLVAAGAAGAEMGSDTVDGFTGIFTKPMEGARDGGAEGFIEGVGAGMSGAVTKPLGVPVRLLQDVSETLLSSVDSIQGRDGGGELSSGGSDYGGERPGHLTEGVRVGVNSVLNGVKDGMTDLVME